MERFVSEGEQFGSLFRRQRVLAGMGTREEFAEKRGVPVNLVAGIEHADVGMYDPHDVIRAIKSLRLNETSRFYLYGLAMRAHIAYHKGGSSPGN